jgi:hypothetical protein
VLIESSPQLIESPPRRLIDAVRRSRVFTRISSSVITVSPFRRMVVRSTSNEAISAATSGASS